MKTMYSTALLTNAIYVEMAVTIAHLILRKMLIIAQTAQMAMPKLEQQHANIFMFNVPVSMHFLH